MDPAPSCTLTGSGSCGGAVGSRSGRRCWRQRRPWPGIPRSSWHAVGEVLLLHRRRSRLRLRKRRDRLCGTTEKRTFILCFFFFIDIFIQSPVLWLRQRPKGTAPPSSVAAAEPHPAAWEGRAVCSGWKSGAALHAGWGGCPAPEKASAGGTVARPPTGPGIRGCCSCCRPRRRRRRRTGWSWRQGCP